MMIKFSTAAWEDYLHWQLTDKAMLKRINQLIRDIQREPFNGIANPNHSSISSLVSGLAE